MPSEQILQMHLAKLVEFKEWGQEAGMVKPTEFGDDPDRGNCVFE